MALQPLNLQVDRVVVCRDCHFVMGLKPTSNVWTGKRISLLVHISHVSDLTIPIARNVLTSRVTALLWSVRLAPVRVAG